MESLYRKKGGLMLETAADNASILSIDLGLLIGLLVLLGLLDPSLGRDLILFGTTVASLLIVYVCVALARHPSARLRVEETALPVAANRLTNHRH
jgi:hypothetical protein